MKVENKLRKKVGKLIKEHRKSLKMNQTEYAEYIGVGRFSTVSSYELGTREAPYKILFHVLANSSNNWFISELQKVIFKE